MHIELWQWILGAGAAVLVGISKTGIPGTGILVVPMLAYAFGGRQSVGIMLPMLIFADCFAVLWYRRHVQWDKLIGLLPWVVAGLVVGAIGLWITGRLSGSVDVIGRVIGVLVLLMLVINLLQGRLGNKLTPTSKIGIAATGTAAGFTTMVSNAAGPIDPCTSPATVKIDEEKTVKWLSCGAQPTTTAKALLKKQNIGIAKKTAQPAVAAVETSVATEEQPTE